MNEPLQQADEGFIAAAIDTYADRLLRYALRLTGDPEMAQDVVQETFLRLCTARRNGLEDHLASWLYTVCRNRAVDLHRKEGRMESFETTSFERLPSLDVPLPTHAEAQDDFAAVRRALTELSGQQREVLRLKFQDGMSYREISDITGLTVTNVGYHIHAALTRVREHIRAAGGD